MVTYPKIGAHVWALFKRPTYIDVVPATVTDISYTTGEAVLRWSQPGMDVTFKRSPKHVWRTKEDAEKALFELTGGRRNPRPDMGEQMSFFTRR